MIVLDDNRFYKTDGNFLGNSPKKMNLTEAELGGGETVYNDFPDNSPPLEDGGENGGADLPPAPKQSSRALPLLLLLLLAILFVKSQYK